MSAIKYTGIVPMTFGVETDGDALILWLHSAPDGFKIDAIRADPRVGFEADCSHNLIIGDRACGFTMEYESVIGNGHMSIIKDRDEKRRGLTSIMRRHAGHDNFEFEDAQLANVCVLRLDVKQITGKRLKK